MSIFPHFLRIFSRKFFASASKTYSLVDFIRLLILASVVLLFVLAWGFKQKDFKSNFVPLINLNSDDPKKNVDAESIMLEIEQTKEVLKLRPDYQRAWLKLAELYRVLGAYDLAKDAKNRADTLGNLVE